MIKLFFLKMYLLTYSLKRDTMHKGSKSNKEVKPRQSQMTLNNFSSKLMNSQDTVTGKEASLKFSALPGQGKSTLSMKRPDNSHPYGTKAPSAAS